MRRNWDGSPVNPNVKRRQPPVHRPLPDRILPDRELLPLEVTDLKAFERLMRAMWEPTIQI